MSTTAAGKCVRPTKRAQVLDYSLLPEKRVYRCAKERKRVGRGVDGRKSDYLSRVINIDCVALKPTQRSNIDKLAVFQKRAAEHRSASKRIDRSVRAADRNPSLRIN